MVFNVKQPNGKYKAKWIGTGLSAPAEKETAEKMMKETAQMFENVNSSKSNNEVSSKIEFESITPQIQTVESKTESEPILLPVLTASGQLVYTQQYQLPEKNLFYKYIKEWLSEKRKDMCIDSTTIEGYDSICSNHLIPFFKKNKMMLEDITYRDIQNYIDHEALSGNKKTKAGLSPKSLQAIKKVLSQIFKQAKRDKLILDNPCEFVKLPKQVKSEPQILDLNQVNKFLENIKNEDLYPVIYITIVYGLRRSEAIALKWDSVDFESKTVTIKHTIVKGCKTVEKDTTKTDSSFRKYPMSDEIKRILLKQKETENENRIKYGNDYIESDYIFKWDDGQFYKPDYVTRKFKALLKKYNMPDIRFHDLRHSCASLLASGGFQIKDIQEWLGHADISTTANIYAHLFTDRKESILNAMDLTITKDDEG